MIRFWANFEPFCDFRKGDDAVQEVINNWSAESSVTKPILRYVQHVEQDNVSQSNLKYREKYV